MGTIWIKELTGGLDTRRLSETTSGGSLVLARDGHINRGGEFEQREAFVKGYTLPAGATHGLAFDNTSLIVFGHLAAPALPAGVAYQRIQHPQNGAIALVKVLSYARFAGKIYVIGEFADGNVFHFYDSVIIEDWYDVRARATFSVVSGLNASPVAATSIITGAGVAPGGAIYSLKVGTTELLTGTINSPTLNMADSLLLIALDVNTNTGTSGYHAAYSGATPNIITLNAVTPGAAPNGLAVTTISNQLGFITAPMSGGADPINSALNNLTIDGVPVIAAPVPWVSSTTQMATDIASAINSGTADYTAAATGSDVRVTAVSLSTSEIGKAVVPYTAGALVLSPASGLTLTAGADGFVPGDFVTTIGKKVYSVSGPNMHFSGIAQPTKWTTDATGAGFIDMSSEAENSENLKAVAKYQQYIAIFAEKATQIWYVDPDPALNKQTQVLNNTGTISAKSVVQFGDVDLFYLDESGIRSLRSRNASTAAATSDIGIPIDTLIIAKLKEIPVDERDTIISVIEPRDGRFWIALQDTIYVFSYFPGSKISAWTTYTPAYFEGATLTPFVVEDMLVFDRRVYIRSGDKIFVYGGLDVDSVYDDIRPEGWLPFLDAGAPDKSKRAQSIEAAIEGVWEVSLATDPGNPGASDLIGTLSKTTFPGDGVPAHGESTHFSLRFKGKGANAKKFASALIRYEDV